jgi:hypothetical protein
MSDAPISGSIGGVYPRRAVRTLPVDAPAVAGYGQPNESLLRRTPGMVIERSRSFIKSARVPGIRESLEVQVMAKLVAQSAEEGSKGSDLFAYRRFHPHADKYGVGVVVAKKLNCGSLADTDGSGGENAHIAVSRNSVEKRRTSLVRPVFMAASIAEAIRRKRSSWGSLSALSLSLSANNCRFFFLGGASVIIARSILPDAPHSNKSQSLRHSPRLHAEHCSR